MSSEASATAASSKTLITVRVSCEIHVACGIQLRITLSMPSNMVDFLFLSFSCSPHRIVCCVVFVFVFVLSRVGKGIVEAHPHYEEWLQLPALMSDGWYFARSAVCLSLPFCPCHQAYYLLLAVLAIHTTYQLINRSRAKTIHPRTTIRDVAAGGCWASGGRRITTRVRLSDCT